MTRILVVEDSPTARALIVALLESDPEFEVVGQAASGREAVEMVGRLRPDLVTMDVVMPDIDGLEATRRIMAIAPTPILIFTAHGDSPELNVAFEALKAGALDVLPKPDRMGSGDVAGWGSGLVDAVKRLARVRPRVTDAPPAQERASQEGEGR